MNIITGSARGTKLITLEGESTRPTLQRAKEVIFSAIQFDIEGRRVLDLFAGSGQLGLEALSRGAEKATFVDRSQEAIAVIDENAKKTHLNKKCVLLNMEHNDFFRASKRSTGVYDLVFLDPPYGSELLPEALSKLITYKLLSDNATVIAEWEKPSLTEDHPELSELYTLEKLYKSGRIYFYKFTIKEN